MDEDTIKVKITAEGRSVSASATGSISTRLRNIYNTLGLSESSVLRAMKRISDDNGYHAVAFARMTKTLRPIPGSARVVDEELQPIVMTSHAFKNNSRYPASYDCRLSHTDTHSVSVSWSRGAQTDAAFEIGYNVGICGSGRMTFTNSVGSGEEYTTQVAVSAGDGVRVDLLPGQRALATLSANRRTVTVRIKYHVEYSGDVLGTYRDHSIMTFELDEILDECNKKKQEVITETINVSYFTDAEVELTDL